MVDILLLQSTGNKIAFDSQSLSKNLGLYSSKFENTILLVDFSATLEKLETWVENLFWVF